MTVNIILEYTDLYAHKNLLFQS